MTTGRPKPDLSAGTSRPAGMNVGNYERLGSGLAGAALAVLGLKRGGLAGLGLAALGAALVKRGATGQCELYHALGVHSDGHAATPTEYDQRGIHVEQVYTIAKPRAELFAFWRDFENLPKFMKHLKSVKVLDDKTSEWTAAAPAGTSVSWKAEIINEVPDELIAWRSLANADVDNAGSVRFLDAPAGRGTEVKVSLDYIPPGGVVGKWAARLFGEEPQQQVQEDLRRFKRLMETGEIPTTEGQPHGQRGLKFSV